MTVRMYACCCKAARSHYISLQLRSCKPGGRNAEDNLVSPVKHPTHQTSYPSPNRPAEPSLSPLITSIYHDVLAAIVLDGCLWQSTRHARHQCLRLSSHVLRPASRGWPVLWVCGLLRERALATAHRTAHCLLLLLGFCMASRYGGVGLP